MALATLGGMNAHASVPLRVSVRFDGIVYSAWTMPSLEPNITSGTRLALAEMNDSMCERSTAVPYEYQAGRPGLVSTDGVEVSIEPSLVSGMLALPTPNRALRTQLISDVVLAASGVVSSVRSSESLALLAVKS